MTKGRIFSGMQPSGRFHLGNYMGALENWVRLQHEYECFFSIVDLHALTSSYSDTSKLQENVMEMAIDWLSAGLDPEKNVIFVQSHVKEHAELALLLGMSTPLSWLERVPTYKDNCRIGLLRARIIIPMVFWDILCLWQRISCFIKQPVFL